MNKVIIVGGGPAGCIAAIAASGRGAQVSLYEKNEKPGKKLYISGKGRCNLTNAADMDTVMAHVVTNPRFLYSAFSAFDNAAVMELMERAGCPLKVERGQRVFPVSDHSSDVIRALKLLMERGGVELHLNEEVRGLVIENGACRGVRVKDGVRHADRVIVATGALSYPSTGSTGDGYRFAENAGHSVTPPRPALVPLTLAEDCSDKMGLSLKNVTASVYDGKKCLFSEFGELLFTHFGVSGPLVLSASSYVTGMLPEKRLKLELDLKPALDEETLDRRILRDFEKNRGRQLKNSLGDLLPSGMIDTVIRASGVAPEQKVSRITREQRQDLVRALKHLDFTVTGTRGWNEAVVTQGGVDVREIFPATMESRLVKGLHFAGEVLDADALTGGFNLQIAWSTGWAAGTAAAG